MEKFKLPKFDGTYYLVTGTARTEVFNSYHKGMLTDASVIELASGEMLLYVNARPVYPMANKCEDVRRIYRNAQAMSTEQIAQVTGRDVSQRILDALGIDNFEVIA
jgi:hypothetical protein